MYKGIAFALSACFIWGLIFVIPQYMVGFNTLEVVMGRYTFYGLVSIILFLNTKWSSAIKYPSPIWFKAFGYALFTNIIYYSGVVLSVRYCTPAVCALILGMSPIAIAFYGNWKEHECSYKRLIFPSLLTFMGLLLINLEHLTNNSESVEMAAYFFGLGCACLALASWSWYVVANARFLKQHPEMSPGEWSTLIGVCTFFWVAIIFVGLSLYLGDFQAFEKYGTWSPELQVFLMGSATLGLLCAWFGAYLWNQASVHLPVSLAGQLTIFETIFGVSFVYMLKGEFPVFLECFGIMLMLAAIMYAINVSGKLKTATIA